MRTKPRQDWGSWGGVSWGCWASSDAKDTLHLSGAVQSTPQCGCCPARVARPWVPVAAWPSPAGGAVCPKALLVALGCLCWLCHHQGWFLSDEAVVGSHPGAVPVQARTSLSLALLLPGLRSAGAGLRMGCMGSTRTKEDSGWLQCFSKPADFNSIFCCV